MHPADMGMQAQAGMQPQMGMQPMQPHMGMQQPHQGMMMVRTAASNQVHAGPDEAAPSCSALACCRHCSGLINLMLLPQMPAQQMSQPGSPSAYMAQQPQQVMVPAQHMPPQVMVPAQPMVHQPASAPGSPTGAAYVMMPPGHGYQPVMTKEPGQQVGCWGGVTSWLAPWLCARARGGLQAMPADSTAAAPGRMQRACTRTPLVQSGLPALLPRTPPPALPD